MMNCSQRRTQSMLALSFIACGILYTGLLYNRVRSDVAPVEKKILIKRPLNNEEKKRIDSALDKAVTYTHEIGKWLEDLFDTENNIAYSEHVKALKKTVNKLKQDFVVPLAPDENTHPTIKTTHYFSLLLLQKIENTYEVVKGYCGSRNPFAHLSLGMALKKVLDSSDDLAKVDETLLELHEQLEHEAPELDEKLRELKETIRSYGDRINSKSWRTLTNGLWHRLGCK
jgi:hypothetical protein